VSYKTGPIFVTNIHRNFIKAKQLMWLHLMEMEKKVADVKGNEKRTDRTVWNMYEMAVLH
jgi:hypothetical protein